MLSIIRLKIECEEEEEYEVVNTEADVWDAGTPFKSLPTIKMTTNTANVAKSSFPYSSAKKVSPLDQ